MVSQAETKFVGGPDRADAALSGATDGLRTRRAGHDSSRVLVDVAVVITEAAVAITDVQSLADKQGLDGPARLIASTPTV